MATMDFAAVLQALNQASSFELYRRDQVSGTKQPQKTARQARQA